jgi:unsaturated rhamnogalacturonyl hydrolase
MHLKSKILVLSMLGMITLFCVSQGMAQTEEFSNWPDGASPAQVGKRVAENFVARKLDFETNPQRQFVIYPEVCAWYGSLTVAKLIKDQDLTTRLINKFDPLLTPEGSKKISPNAHVDYRVFGIVPLEIYMQTKDKKYLEIGQGLADKQWEKTTEDGITSEARYWIDDMYMIPAVQVQAFRATNDAKYLDRAALTMVAYLDKLQQPNGLFFHGTDAPFFWSRGNGWMAAGMSELLTSLPQDHPKRARIMEGYKKMMATILSTQDSDGTWHQLIDQPDFWPETSGTGMFAFAMVTGVKNGWLDAKTYAPAARKAWLGLVKYLDKDANVREVCVGTGKGKTLDYYRNRARKTGDLHGQAPILWTATALLR